jgi:N-acetylglucosaminyldiphosphoundecaprenol N-acetyl-beta-D-mannosaminyltransferase
VRHQTLSIETIERTDPPPVAPAGFSRHPVDWINLLGVRVSAVNMTSAVACILDAVATGRKGYVCLRDVHGIVRSQGDPALQQAHNRAFLVTPDGMPLVWALKAAGHKTADRVYGPDLMLALFDHGRWPGLRHFLYGTTPEVLSRLSARLTQAFPGAEIAGTYSPPFRPLTSSETETVAAEINATRADIVWVGLSSPKQEHWMAEMRPLLDAGMLVGVGAAFDFHAGVKKQAPRFIQRSGFEWLFRLASEPRRLFARYAVVVPSFLALVALQVAGLKQFPMAPRPEPGTALSTPSRHPV